MSTAGSGVFCPRCGTHNPVPAAACTNCGTALPVRPAAPPSVYPPPAAPQGGYPPVGNPPANYPPGGYPPGGYPPGAYPPGAPSPPPTANKVKLMTVVLIIAGLFVPLWPISLPLCWYLAYQTYKNP